MSETAIPINHSLAQAYEFVAAKPVIDPKDRSVANLALEPGWDVLEAEIDAEIARLKNYEYTPGDSVEAYGFKALAASLCISKFEWLKTRVRTTERTVREHSRND